MTASELEDLLVARLVRGTGGSKRAWRTALGPVRVYRVETHPHCNWSVTPSGSAGQVATIERMLDEVRSRHPLVVPG